MARIVQVIKIGSTFANGFGVATVFQRVEPKICCTRCASVGSCACRAWTWTVEAFVVLYFVVSSLSAGGYRIAFLLSGVVPGIARTRITFHLGILNITLCAIHRARATGIISGIIICPWAADRNGIASVCS